MIISFLDYAAQLAKLESEDDMTPQSTIKEMIDKTKKLTKENMVRFQRKENESTYESISENEGNG